MSVQRGHKERCSGKILTATEISVWTQTNQEAQEKLPMSCAVTASHPLVKRNLRIFYRALEPTRTGMYSNTFLLPRLRIRTGVTNGRECLVENLHTEFLILDSGSKVKRNKERFFQMLNTSNRKQNITE